jgi:hypothetical protein
MSIRPSPLALDIARHLVGEWSIGLVWRDDDKTDIGFATEEEIAAAIDTILLPRLAAHADAIEDALNGSVDSRPYPDGPNLDRDTRAALRKSLEELKP